VNRVLANVNDPGPIHPMNGFASPTPAVAGDKVICHFGQYGTFCLDAGSGETLWTQTLPCDDSVGPGSSPVVVGDNVIITCDGIDQQYVAALSLADGTLAWRTSRPPMRTSNVEFQKAYCTPTIVDVDGQTQVIITGAQWCVAYDPMSGKEIWRFDHGSGFSVATMALPVGDVVVFSSGYTSPELFAIEPTGQGNVTSTHLRWRMARNVPTKPSLASDGKLLYVISDDGILSAVSVIDGSQVYRQRIGGMFSSSPFISGDRVLIGNHEGEVTIFQTGSQYHQVARFDLGDQIMASPVPVGDDLLIRTKAELMRFGPSR
ncbi:MAG: PQQ-binding-like beta-propeller repeat protein, partial [Planctomycetota bacterium]